MSAPKITLTCRVETLTLTSTLNDDDLRDAAGNIPPRKAKLTFRGEGGGTLDVHMSKEEALMYPLGARINLTIELVDSEPAPRDKQT